jgi:hypothetical protein
MTRTHDFLRARMHSSTQTTLALTHPSAQLKDESYHHKHDALEVRQALRDEQVRCANRRRDRMDRKVLLAGVNHHNNPFWSHMGEQSAHRKGYESTW